MHELRTALGGAGLALAMGLVLGGAMRPNLAGEDRPAGPQTILGQAATRPTGPLNPSVSAYPGRTPDYVMGTDWKRNTEWPDREPVQEPPLRRIARDNAPPPPEFGPPAFARTDFNELSPPAPRGRYPSLGGEGLPTHAPVGQAIDDADEEAPTA
jgi:hypothetical protein